MTHQEAKSAVLRLIRQVSFVSVALRVLNISLSVDRWKASQLCLEQFVKFFVISDQVTVNL